jgi:hypothetical protein
VARIRRVSELKGIVDAEIVWGDGCGLVFADLDTESRTVFDRYCESCRRKGKKLRRAEIVSRVSAAVRNERLPAIGGWRATCSNCGDRFFTTTPQRRRCDRCRH